MPSERFFIYPCLFPLQAAGILFGFYQSDQIDSGSTASRPIALPSVLFAGYLQGNRLSDNRKRVGGIRCPLCGDGMAVLAFLFILPL
jgi:hypothetical protein